MENLKFMLVNNYSRFASKDVWDAFIGTFRNNLKYDVLAYPVDQLSAFFSSDMQKHHILSTAVSTRNNFTHAILISSTFLDKWVIESIRRCGVKVIYWSLEDPHALDQNFRFMDEADYYFTNEKAVARQFDNAYYLPTAGAHTVCAPPAIPLNQMEEREREIFDNDVVFCGNVYPNRQRFLEQLVPEFEKNGIGFGIMGITGLMEDRENSVLLKHIKFGKGNLVDHRYVIMAYGFSKFIINIERDPFYEYNEQFSTNRKYKIIGESLNPRAYEIALTGGGLQLIDDKRKEIFEEGILEPTKHCVVYTSAQDLVEKVIYYKNHEDERKAIVDAARDHALKNHTYFNRAKRMIDIINLKEGRKREVAASAISRIFSGGKIKTKNAG